MVRIRLNRRGAKKKPFYRIVAADQRCKRDGRFIEQLGFYDPMRDPHVVKVDLEKFDAWVAKGAQPSDTVARLVEGYRKVAGAEQVAS